MKGVPDHEEWEDDNEKGNYWDQSGAGDANGNQN